MPHLLADKQTLFIGAGSMAEAIIRGIVTARITSPVNISVTNRSSRERLEQLREQYGIRTGCGPEATEDYLREADVVVLAMKPKDAGAALAALKPFLRSDQLLISVIAGLSLSTMEELLCNGMPIARSMPNTSSSIGLGATGLCFSSTAVETDRQLAMEIFTAVGLAVPIEEQQMDVLTGVSGSGPAYIYYMMEAMIKAGKDGGLTDEQARSLTVQTVLGAASMVQSTGEDPAELRRKVTSPNGTTEAAIQTLDRGEFQETVQKAVHRAAERSGELGAMITDGVRNSR